MATKDTGGQDRASRREQEVDETEAVDTSEVQERVGKLTDDVDALLDEIDDVLETNAEEFVKGFVQNFPLSKKNEDGRASCCRPCLRARSVRYRNGCRRRLRRDGAPSPDPAEHSQRPCRRVTARRAVAVHRTCGAGHVKGR
jgi:ubiquitin-like protein Pup